MGGHMKQVRISILKTTLQQDLAEQYGVKGAEGVFADE